MKANHLRISALTLALTTVAAITAACSERRVEPTPTASPAPPPAVQPAPSVDWREAAITPGDWKWSMIDGRSVATFASGLLRLRCDQPGGTLTILRRGETTSPVPMTIVTQQSVRALNGSAEGEAIAIALPARDPLLDAMAFSRGRFAIEVAGLPTLYVPSWPEVSRVIEDCR